MNSIYGVRKLCLVQCCLIFSLRNSHGDKKAYRFYNKVSQLGRTAFCLFCCCFDHLPSYWSPLWTSSALKVPRRIPFLSTSFQFYHHLPSFLLSSSSVASGLKDYGRLGQADSGERQKLKLLVHRIQQRMLRLLVPVQVLVRKDGRRATRWQ